jgi:5'-nucleotidase (lipoprotein e(P4) family)
MSTPRPARIAVGPFVTGAAVLLLSACATPAPRTAVPAPATDPLEIHWVRTAAEHRAVYEEVYHWATTRVETLAAGEKAGTWAVILDADETVLDNSPYQLRRARQGLGYTPESWNAWVDQAAAPALPGAVAFVKRVRELGGKVAIVTNRDDALCGPTRRNLDAVGIDPDVVLCRTDVESKERRFTAVETGDGTGLGPLDVVAWVGDNIQDFPGGTQAWRDGAPEMDNFGIRYFALPNPMYGSWVDNPPR